MATLSDEDRLEDAGEFMAEEVSPFGAVTKLDIRAAYNALDSFFDSNAAAINNAIPQPARSQLTTAQKARLLMRVISKRYIKGV